MPPLIHIPPVPVYQLDVIKGCEIRAHQPCEVVLYVVHGDTQKLAEDFKLLHLFVIDSSLTDYQEPADVRGKNPREFRIRFVPKHDHDYHVWLYVEQKETGARPFLQVKIPGKNSVQPDSSPQSSVLLQEEMVSFHRSEEPLRVGQSAQLLLEGMVLGGTWRELRVEHLVGFYESGMPVEFLKAENTGTPEQNTQWKFSFTPARTGPFHFFVKAWVDDKVRLLPFMVEIK